MKPVDSESPELCLNLWYVMDGGTGMVYVLFARAYCLTGGDDEKLEVLQRLSFSDFATAQKFQPRRGIDAHGYGRMEHMTTPQMVNMDILGTFAEFFESLEEDPPAYMVFVGGQGHVRKIGLGEDPLYVLTALVDDSEGHLVPLVDEESMSDEEAAHIWARRMFGY